MTRVVLGFPMYRAEDFLAETLDSLLAMDFDDFAIVAVDDCSDDRTLEIARSYARRDARLIVEAHARRVGMIANWNAVLIRARELFPEFDYFAWASDNDLRDPNWLSSIVRALDDDPTAILGYSMFATVDDGSGSTPKPHPLFDLRDVADPVARFRRSLNGMPTGAMMYGLHRRETLARIGLIPRVLASDMAFLTHLSLYGRFRQEPAVFWYRGARRTGGSVKRHRDALFAGNPPLWTYLPVEIQHALWLVGRLVLRGDRPDGVGRTQAMLLSVELVRVRRARRRHQRQTARRKRRTKQLKALRKLRRRLVGGTRRRRLRAVHFARRVPKRLRRNARRARATAGRIRRSIVGSPPSG